MKFNLTVIIAVFGFIANAQAARFANKFIEFEAPGQWACALEGAEWVCQSKDEKKKRDAIIVLAAKLKGQQDSVDQYLSYLKRVKNYTSLKGTSVRSEVRYAKSKEISGHEWADGLHLESEIPGFYTRYLATTKSDIAVLVTYSVAKSKWTDYQEIFSNMVETMQVFRKPGLGLNTSDSDSNLFQRISDNQYGGGGGTFADLSDDQVADGGGMPGVDKGYTGSGSSDLALLVILLAGVGGFIYFKKKRG